MNGWYNSFKIIALRGLGKIRKKSFFSYFLVLNLFFLCSFRFFFTSLLINILIVYIHYEFVMGKGGDTGFAVWILILYFLLKIR